MSKTSELVERYAVEELKTQIAESNSNPYLGIYGVILGLVVVNAGYINNAFQEVYRVNAWYYTFGYGFAFVSSFLLAIYFVIMQASGTLVKNAHSFKLDQEAYRFAAEERANLLANATDDEQLEKIDLQVSENVRRRLTERVLEVNKKYRKANIEKAWSQRATALCLIIVSLTVLSAFILPIGERNLRQDKPTVNTEIGKTH